MLAIVDRLLCLGLRIDAAGPLADVVGVAAVDVCREGMFPTLGSVGSY